MTSFPMVEGGPCREREGTRPNCRADTRLRTELSVMGRGWPTAERE
jgi:hypothetical protein